MRVEYPKALYKNGTEKENTLTVESAEEEKIQKSLGYLPWNPVVEKKVEPVKVEMKITTELKPTKSTKKSKKAK